MANSKTAEVLKPSQSLATLLPRLLPLFALPVSIVIALPLIILHDLSASRDTNLIFAMAEVLAEEARHEAGEPVSADEKWNLTYAAALDEQRELLTHFMSILDAEDLRYVVTSGDDNVSSELRAIMSRLDGCASENESRDAIQHVARQMDDLQDRILESTNGRHSQSQILFNFEPSYVSDYRRHAIKQIANLEARVSALKRKLEWDSESAMIGSDLSDREKLDEIIEDTTAACRASRVAYVFTLTVYDNSEESRELCERYLSVQYENARVVTAFAKHEALFEDRYHSAREWLETYCHSMSRRISRLTKKTETSAAR